MMSADGTNDNQPTIMTEEPAPEEVGHEPNNDDSAAMAAHSHPRSVATLSQAWEYDDLQHHCAGCATAFTAMNRKHHCRYCGKIFCHNCSRNKCLIPPSAIVLIPKGGKKVSSAQAAVAAASFSPDEDPDRMLTYVASGDSQDNNNNNNNNMPGGGGTSEVLLYGKGLEERFKLAREPLRVCQACCQTLQPVQEELRYSNSHAMRFNHIDPTDPRRLFNSPLAFTLGHEVRKAAYTLNNLLPIPKRRAGAIMNFGDYNDEFHYRGTPGIHEECQDVCGTVSPNLANVDGTKIPAKLLEQAKGIAIMTVIKGGFGLAGVEFGTGLVVARLGSSEDDGAQWSAPSAIGTAGLSWGALVGAQVSDHVFLCMTDAAVEMMFSANGSVQLGADIGVAVGPVGRALEADFGANPNSAAPIYTYSLSKGLYAGVSLDGKVIVTRNNVNEKFYGRAVTGEEILSGAVPTPPAAQPLYDALTRCHVYASSAAVGGRLSQTAGLTSSIILQQGSPSNSIYPRSADMEYGELPEPMPMAMGPSNWYDGNPGNSMPPVSSSVYPYNNNMSGTNSQVYAQAPPPGQPSSYPVQQSQPGFSQMPPQANAMPQQQQQQQQSPLYAAQPTVVKLPPKEQQDQGQPLTMPPAHDDGHSYAGMSDITSDPGY